MTSRLAGRSLPDVVGTNSHPMGELIGIPNSLNCSTERLQRVITW